MLDTVTDWHVMKQGDKDAFLRIYESHYQILFRYGFSITCDKEITKDCIQEMFLELWNTKGTVNSVQNVRSYLCTWLRRRISRFQAKYQDNLSDVSSAAFQDTESSYEELLIAFQETEEKKDKLRRALDNLTKKQLELIKLKFFENLSYAEISAKTSLQVRTIYNTIHTAIEKLREQIKAPQNA